MMQQAWADFRKGWGEARWSTYFALYLVPFVLVALLFARLLPWGWNGDPAAVPGPIGFILILTATVLAFARTIQRDGPDGWLGQHFFWLFDLPHLHAAETAMLRFAEAWEEVAPTAALVYYLEEARETIQRIQTHSPRYSVLLQAISHAEYLLTLRHQAETAEAVETQEPAVAG